MQTDEWDLVPSPTLITDLEGYVIKYNTAFNDINVLEDDVQEAIHIEALLPLPSRIFFQTHLFPMLRKYERVEELFFYLKNTAGESIPVMCNSCKVQYKGHGAYFWVMFVARERQKFEAELIKTKKDLEQANIELKNSQIDLKRANAELGKFVHTVSHDIRSPLVTVEMFSKKLFKDLERKLSEKHTHKFERIFLNISHLKRMIEGLLLQSKSESLLTKEKILLSDITDELQLILQGELEESKAHITVTTSGEPIYANRLLLTQCLQNLLSNAIRYREHNRTPVINISQESRETYSIVHIKDNGIGIPEGNLEKIFDLFQGDSRREGSGVGLSIVKSVMEKHNGTVSVESVYGEGSCFTLEFPSY